MNKEEVKNMLLKRVDVKGLLIEDLLRGVIKVALEKVAADSSNKFDDAAVAWLYPMLEEAAVKWLDENVVSEA